MSYRHWLMLVACLLPGAIGAPDLAAQTLNLEPLPPIDAVLQPVGYEDYFDVGSVVEPGAIAPLPAPPGGPPPTAAMTPPACPPQDEACPHCPCADCCCWPCECPCPPAACLPCPRINLINPCWQLLVGGNITLDMLFNSSRPVAPGTPFFLTPSGPFSDSTFDMHARQTTMYFALMGPQMGNFRSGGLILFNLYNDSVSADRYGFLPYQAYGELKNEYWRFAGGLQSDIFAPLLPTVLPFSYLMASGNTGVFRGQLRAERFFYPAFAEQITFTAGISEPISTVYNNSTLVTGSTALTEDNGIPDLEMRLAWAVGPESQVGLETRRPFEVGISTVLGQIRTTFAPPLTRVVDDVWGVAADFRWRVNDLWGFSGELFHGQTLGTYGGGVFQNVNSVTFTPVHATGGWLQFDWYYTPCLHSHFGFGVDDPANSELALGQIGLNQTVFANLIWDLNTSFRIAGELTFRETDYVGPAALSNDGVGIQGQMQWKF
ncbi:MAG TPA: hypothetical protein VFV87_04395 [Pirellulaceae bacterium]|nr:hypothetical protein [Pirellulaceae bacterium]